jgi:hypothetical protein
MNDVTYSQIYVMLFDINGLTFVRIIKDKREKESIPFENRV